MTLSRTLRRSVALLSFAAAAGCGDKIQTSPADSPPYSITLTPSSLGVIRGRTSRINIDVDRTGFSGTITLRIEELPSGVTATVEPATLNGGVTQSVLTLTASTTATIGSYVATLRGESPGTTTFVQGVAITVVAAP